MKKLLIGLSNNVSLNKKKIKVWAKSYKKYCDGDLILIIANSNNDDIETCKNLNIKYYEVIVEDTWYINNKRLFHTKNLLKMVDADICLITDVFDVIFQSDPFVKLNIDEYNVFVGSEGIKLSQEPWNSDVMYKVFPNELSNCLNNDIICSGVIGGKISELIKLYEKLDYLCENSLNGHNIKDQAALNIMIAKNEIEKLKIFEVSDGWTLHCATGGPTEYFESWGFKNMQIKKYGGIPYLKENIIYTYDGKIYDIVHQFNRINEWNNIITKSYE